MVNENIEDSPKKKSRLFGRKAADATAPATPPLEPEASEPSASDQAALAKAPARKRTAPKRAADHVNTAASDALVAEVATADVVAPAPARSRSK